MNNLNYVCTYSVPAFHHSTTLIPTTLPKTLLGSASDHLSQKLNVGRKTWCLGLLLPLDLALVPTPRDLSLKQKACRLFPQPELKQLCRPMYGFGLQTNFSDGLLRLLSSIALVQPCMANGVRISPVSDEATNGKLQKLKRDTSLFSKGKSGMK